MHTYTICTHTHTRTDFIVTGSQDGHVKFWKKQVDGVEFVKHFRAHLGEMKRSKKLMQEREERCTRSL